MATVVFGNQPFELSANEILPKLQGLKDPQIRDSISGGNYFFMEQEGGKPVVYDLSEKKPGK
jgi:hypothetical protein